MYHFNFSILLSLKARKALKLRMSPADTSQRFASLSVAAFAVCIFARMRLPMCEHPAVTFGSSAHGSLLRAKFQFLDLEKSEFP